MDTKPIITELKVGQRCYVHRPENKFEGKVSELRTGWARVFGKGSILDTHFDEWFPIISKSVWIEPLRGR